jgi:hypothetical protein
MIWGNILIGGWIGAGVDSLTDAHWNISDSLVLYRNHCGQNNLTSTTQQTQPSSQIEQPSSQAVRPTSQNVQPTNRTVQPTTQQTQPSSQKVQDNKAINNPNYIVAPRPSSLRAVDARDKDDCELIMSITKNAGGAGDMSQFVKSAKKSAITEAINNGANSYFIVSTESNLYGASVTLEALKCK